MSVVNVHDAKARLSELIDRALAGEEVVIARRNRPLVKLTIVESARARPQPGRLKGRIWMAPDFDEPMADFADYTS